MHSFWKWLMRANARLIFLSAAIGLCAVVIFWIWKLHAPVQAASFQPSAAQTRRTMPSIGILAMLDDLAQGIPEAPSNFFLAPDPPRPRTPPQPPTPPPQQPAQNMQPQQQQAPGQQKPPPPPKRNIVSIVYRGIFQAPDGRRLALIEDATAGRQAFVSQSNQLHGVTVAGFDQTNVSLIFSDGSTGSMELLKPLNIEGGRIAN